MKGRHCDTLYYQPSGRAKLDKYLPGLQAMTDLHNAVIIVLVILVTGIGGTSATIFAILKWYLPNQFKHRDDSRQLEIDNLRDELATKRASDAVEIERDRMLPLMVENNQRLVDAMIKSKDADTAATYQRIELDKQAAAVLAANTQQITTHSDRLEENTDRLEQVEKKVDLLYNRFVKVFPRDSNILDLFDELKNVVEETKTACAEKKSKGDSQPIPSVTIPVDKGTILLTGIEPGDLEQKAG